jgi:hypothetical protein
MTIQVRVLGDPWVFDPMGAGVGAICIRRNDPNKGEFGHEFYFASAGEPGARSSP